MYTGNTIVVIQANLLVSYMYPNHATATVNVNKESVFKAWSHRRTDMYRRENGLKYAEFGYPVTKFISSAIQSSRDWYVEPGS